ncbi:MAG: hypothetical protein HQL54_07200 [Magnetococcales bacterium]|nr:hypothetical protein [Magnetococcales bacterium]
MVNEKIHIFDKPANIKRLLTIFYSLCGVLLLLEFVVHRHSAIEADQIPGFYAFYGLTACVILVILAKQMRKLVMRSEDYYQSNDNEDAAVTVREDTHV